MLCDIAHEVVEILIERNISISTMESCTSGMLASLITDTPGASAVFPGGVVTYANAAKVRHGVDAAVIETYGVYSPQCARAMAQAVQGSFGTDLAIGITGTTGNVDPNNADSTVGEAYFCIAWNGRFLEETIAEDVSGLDRHAIKEHYAGRVFECLREMLRSV